MVTDALLNTKEVPAGYEAAARPLFLTRTRYLNGLVCPKMLWLRINRRERFGESKISPQAVENSRNVQICARKLFDPVTVIEHDEYAVMEEKTGEILRRAASDEDMFSGSGRYAAIAHAALSFQNCHALIDILALRPDGRFEIYMVKSAVHVSAQAREDLAYQYYVCRMAGLPVEKAGVLYLNREYVRKGQIEPEKLFRILDLTSESKNKMAEVRDRISGLRIYLAEEREPRRALSEGCFSPYDCSCFSSCGKELPEWNVFRLAATQLQDKLRFYEEGRIGFEDFVSEEPAGNTVIPGISAAAGLQILCELEKRPLQADRTAVREFLRTLWKPLYFLDFEAFQPSVPKYEGTRPFETIVFQYSVHGLPWNNESPARRELIHRDFLGDPECDPRRALSEKLVRDIPEDACILTYNSAYEKKRIAELAALFPDLSGKLMNLHSRVMDLMPLFRDRKVYDRRMQGSYSLKSVLPALFPDDPALDYENLPGVSNGGEAADSFQMLSRLFGEAREKLSQEMLRYCALDTFAMVKIVERLEELSG